MYSDGGRSVHLSGARVNRCQEDYSFFKGYSLSLKVFADTMSDPLLRFSEDSRIPSLLIEEEPVL